jgi:hypothetical protein
LREIAFKNNKLSGIFKHLSIPSFRLRKPVLYPTELRGLRNALILYTKA